MKPSERTYQILSREAYAPQGGKPPQGWKVLSTTSHDNFYASAYIHPETKQVVIAFRGTNPDKPEHLINDLQILLKKQPYFEKFALDFSKSIEEKLKGNQAGKSWQNDVGNLNGYQISYTGHSLGGLLAQLVALRQNRAAVVFESPGALDIVSKNPKDYHLAKNNITIINTVPDIINSVSRHITKPKYIKVDSAKPLCWDISRVSVLLAAAIYTATGSHELITKWKSLPSIVRFTFEKVVTALFSLVCHFGIQNFLLEEGPLSFSVKFADIASKLLHYHSMDTIDKAYRDANGHPATVDYDPMIAERIRQNVTKLLTLDMSDFKSFASELSDIVDKIDEPIASLPEVSNSGTLQGCGVLS